METPTIKRKKGKTKSVGVAPCHSACSKGAYTCDQLPGSLTIIIPTYKKEPEKKKAKTKSKIENGDKSTLGDIEALADLKKKMDEKEDK